MTLIDIMKNRETTFTWSDQKVDKQEVVDIIQQVVENAPSKQNRRVVRVDIFDWSNKQLREELFAWTHRDDELTIEEDQGNPQMLAPIVLVFSPRDVTGEKFGFEDNGFADNDDGFKKNTHLEAGILSASIVYALESAGYNTGYCKCWPGGGIHVEGLNLLEGERTAIEHIKNLLELPWEPILFIGVGHKSDSKEYYDPRVNKNRPIPTHGVKPTPPKTEKVVIVRD